MIPLIPLGIAGLILLAFWIHLILVVPLWMLVWNVAGFLVFGLGGALLLLHLLPSWVSPTPEPASSDPKPIVVITGGANGLGLDLVQKVLDRKRYQVAILDRMEPPKELLKHSDVHYFACDLTWDAERIKKVLDQVEPQLKSEIHVLVNNAGLVNGKSLLDLDEKEITRVFQVNSIAHFWTVRAVLPKFIERKRGHIVSLASTMGLMAVADLCTNSKCLCAECIYLVHRVADYCASKYAVVGFHEALRQEINDIPADHAIRTTLVCPGHIATQMFQGLKTTLPFLTPPLQVHWLANLISDRIHTPMTRAPALLARQRTLKWIWESSGKGRRHAVYWVPSIYYGFCLMQIVFPVWLTDAVKDVLGANSALRGGFHQERRAIPH